MYESRFEALNDIDLMASEFNSMKTSEYVAANAAWTGYVGLQGHRLSTVSYNMI